MFNGMNSHKPVSDLGCSSVNIGRLLAKKSITVANMFGFIGAQSTKSSLNCKIKFCSDNLPYICMNLLKFLPW